MAEQVHEKVQDGVAVLTLDRPPGNALAAPLRAELLDRLTTVLADESMRAVVLTGAGERFSAGIDLAELDAPPEASRLADIAQVIEDAPKPVVVALHGSALGGGFELALAAHARVAKLGTRIALPEVTLGLLPDGGATQRLPRLVGAQAALDLILSGRAFDVSNERLAKVFDRVVEDAPVAAAVEIAKELAESGQWSRTRDRTEGLGSAAAFQAAVTKAEAALRDPESVQADIVACVEAAQLLPFDQGLHFESARFQDRCRSPRARGIRHSFVAERRAATLPVDISNRAQRPESSVVFGTSPMVAELAVMGLGAGLKVCVECGDARQSEAMVSRVRVLLTKGLTDGQFTAPDHDAMLARLQAARNGNELDEADLVFDTANLTPTPSVEQKPGAVWILVSDKVSAAERAGEVASELQIASVRVQRPAHLASLWELSAPDTTSRAALATAHSVLSKAGRSVIWTPDLPFGVSDAIMSTMFRVALVMLAAGFKPDRIDAAAQSLGFAQGPLKTIDDAGAARCLDRMKQIFEAREVTRRPLRLLSDRLSDVTEGGRLPVNSALAFHLAAGRRPEFDPGLRSWVAEWRDENPDRSVLWPGGTLETALHAALVNEAARLIATKTVQRASDFDLVAVKAAGFDREKGGPLLQADMVGLLGLLRAMARLEEIDADLWRPHSLLPEMVKNGRRFF